MWKDYEGNHCSLVVGKGTLTRGDYLAPLGDGDAEVMLDRTGITAYDTGSQGYRGQEAADPSQVRGHQNAIVSPSMRLFTFVLRRKCRDGEQMAGSASWQ
jgi:hypothetical protein